MLLVFTLFAALLVAGMYTIFPRYVFQGQRQKEDELIFRGQQYTRAIQLFVRKYGRYPLSLDELEKTNEIRFLRKRYPDPMTSDGQWRLIHVAPGPVFYDALNPPITNTGYPSGSNQRNGPGNDPFNLPRDNSGSNNPNANPQQPSNKPQQKSNSQTFGSGGAIAGVASKSDGEAIKVVNGYHHYNEWEFIFNYTTDKLAMLAMTRGSAVQQTTPQSTQQQNKKP